jgi:hypothetical protein
MVAPTSNAPINPGPAVYATADNTAGSIRALAENPMRTQALDVVINGHGRLVAAGFYAKYRILHFDSRGAKISRLIRQLAGFFRP